MEFGNYATEKWKNQFTLKIISKNKLVNLFLTNLSGSNTVPVVDLLRACSKLQKDNNVMKIRHGGTKRKLCNSSLVTPTSGIKLETTASQTKLILSWFAVKPKNACYPIHPSTHVTNSLHKNGLPETSGEHEQKPRHVKINYSNIDLPYADWLATKMTLLKLVEQILSGG